MSMTKNEALSGIVLERFINERLPRILDIRDKVKKGEVLNEIDIHFFEKVMKDNKENQYLIEEDEMLKKVYARAMHIYKEITQIALENEQKKSA